MMLGSARKTFAMIDLLEVIWNRLRDIGDDRSVLRKLVYMFKFNAMTYLATGKLQAWTFEIYSMLPRT